VELGFENGIVDDIFFVPGYDLHGFVVAQVKPSVKNFFDCSCFIYIFKKIVLSTTTTKSHTKPFGVSYMDPFEPFCKIMHQICPNIKRF
jgi:hypothetical protein